MLQSAPQALQSVILIRATKLNERTIAFAEALSKDSGLSLVFLVDGRFETTLAHNHKELRITRQTCEAMGLYCPDDFAWRCGDYGLYMARREFPEIRHFWLIEYDVRIGSAAEFFSKLDGFSDADFIATHLRRADPSWFWYPYALGRDTPPHRCMFSALRISSKAIDIIFEKRKSHSSRYIRRKYWPNDESFVATTLFRAGIQCHDFNSICQNAYDEQSFSYEPPIDGEKFRLDTESAHLFHPVLFGTDFNDKVTRSTEEARNQQTMFFRRQENKIWRWISQASPW